ncbi:MAG: hypothetical protein GX787_04795 [Tissierellia bacterium]|jgi:hypothetical protein|nr:hypothetical protein [Tissierellia bacterium]
MWTTIYVATGYEHSKEIVDKLAKEGFLVKHRLFGQDGEDELYEILAPSFESQDVQMAMMELGIL